MRCGLQAHPAPMQVLLVMWSKADDPRSTVMSYPCEMAALAFYGVPSCRSECTQPWCLHIWTRALSCCCGQRGCPRSSLVCALYVFRVCVHLPMPWHQRCMSRIRSFESMHQCTEPFFHNWASRAERWQVIMQGTCGLCWAFCHMFWLSRSGAVSSHSSQRLSCVKNTQLH